MTQARRLASRLAGTAIVLILAAGCGEPAPSVACLGTAAVSVTMPAQRLTQVSHEAEGAFELVRFAFAAADAGTGTPVIVTAEPADGGPYLDARFGEPVQVAGARTTSIRIEGLVGGADTDRLRADATEPYLIREIAQVRDDGAARWIVGTREGTCLQLVANEPGRLVVLRVTVAD